MATANLPTSDEIRAIATDELAPFASIADSIALEYHALATALEERLGGKDLTWCGFAKWTSQAVGVSLRLAPGAKIWTDLRSAFPVPRWLASTFRRVMLRLLGKTYDRALSFANRAIFLEMGTFFVDFLSPLDRSAVHRSRAQLDGLPIFASTLVRSADESLLETAAKLYGKAGANLLTPVTKSRRILGANIALSAFEQKRAQGALELVLYRPVRWALVACWRWPYSTRSEANRSARYAYFTRSHDQMGWVVRRAESAWARLYTRRVFAIVTPVGKVYVGRALSLPESGSPVLRDTEANQYEEDVRELVDRFHPSRERRFDGVVNWLDYDDRMRFIVSYFVLYQQVPRMRDLPPELQPRAPRTPFGKLMDGLRDRVSGALVPVPEVVDPAFACTLIPVAADPIQRGPEPPDEPPLPA